MNSISLTAEGTPRKIAPKGAGTLRYDEAKRCYVGRISLADGSRPWVTCPPSPKSKQAEDKAQQYVGRQAEKARAHKLTGEDFGLVKRKKAPENAPAPAPQEEGETASKWADRRYAWLKGRPRTETLEERKRTWANWVDPILGKLAIATVTANDLRRMVDHLEKTVAAEKIVAKTASNIWGEVTGAFADACESNDSTIRVRDDNPCDKVRGPAGGVDRAQTVLRPAEVEALLRGRSVIEGREDVPLYRRELAALAIYTACRVGELRAITPEDVDFQAMQITIAREADRVGNVKERTKNRRARLVRIEPNLLPLLRILVARKGKTLLARHNEDHARLLREDLETVGVTRAAIFADTDLQMPLTFHGLRHTCLTHMAVRRDPPQDVQWRAGHQTAAQTESYIAEARYEAGVNFGVPLAPLPETFLTEAREGSNCPANCLEGALSSDFPLFLCEGRELNPYRSNPAGT